MTVNNCVLKKCGFPNIIDCYLDTESSFDMSKQTLWVTVSNGSRIIFKHYCVGELQQKLMSNDSNRNLLSILERKEYSVLESVLDTDLFSEEIPEIEEASEVLQFIYYELMNGSNSAYYVEDPDLEEFASYFGLTGAQLEKCLSKDIVRFDLQNVLGLHEYDAAVYAFAGILSCFSIEDKMKKVIRQK